MNKTADWGVFDDAPKDFVVLEDEKEKLLELSFDRIVSNYTIKNEVKPAACFSVWHEDGKDYDGEQRKWYIVSKRLVKKLAPLADAAGVGTKFKVKIIKSGQGYDTHFYVSQIGPGEVRQ